VGEVVKILVGVTLANLPPGPYVLRTTLRADSRAAVREVALRIVPP
jgi:hypothetical protein